MIKISLLMRKDVLELLFNNNIYNAPLSIFLIVTDMSLQKFTTFHDHLLNCFNHILYLVDPY
jgi:hypothetical protein